MRKFAVLLLFIATTLPVFSQTWTGGTSAWILTPNPDAPEVNTPPHPNTTIWRSGNYGTDYTIDAQYTQLAPTGTTGVFYGLALETTGTGVQKVEICLQQLSTLLVRKYPGPVVMSSVALPQQLNDPCNLRVVATDDRIQVFSSGTKYADVIGTGTLTGKTGLFSYGIQARVSFSGTAWGAPPVLEKECQDVRAVESGTNAWWFPGAGQSIALPMKVRDAAVNPRTLTAQYTLTHGGTTTVSSGPVDFTPSLPRSWTSKIINVTTGTENLYWLNVKNAAIPALVYGNWPVARHATPAVVNTFSGSTFVLGIFVKDLPEVLPALDFVARRTYLHALSNAALRDGFNTFYGLRISSPVELDVLKQYGLSAAISPIWLNAQSNPAVMQHDATFGYVFGDEPTEANTSGYASWYSWYQATWPGRPVLTAMAGDGCATHDYHKLWRDIGAQHRVFRNYTFRKNPYDWLNVMTYKRHLGVDAINWLNAGLTTPWYFCPQTFGWGIGQQPFYRSTTGPEATSSLWLTAAHGAKGYFCYVYQGYDPNYEDPLVAGLTLLPTSPLNTTRLDAVRTVNQKIKNWALMPASTLGKPSLPARITFGTNACPTELYVRKLDDGTLAFINLDTKNPLTYIGASDISQNATFTGTAGYGATWNGSTVTIQPGGIAFANTTSPGLWRPASTTFFQTFCQSLINAVTPNTGAWPSEAYNLTIYEDHEWSRTPRNSADGAFSPLAAFRLMESHKPGVATGTNAGTDAWKMRWGTGTLISQPTMAIWMHRQAQVAYGHSARNVHDGNNVTVKFGPYTANNNPPAPHVSSNFNPTDFVANGTFFDFDAMPSNPKVLLLSRTWDSGRVFTMAINLSGTSQNFTMSSHNYVIPLYKKVYDVYTGTSSMVNLNVSTVGLRTVTTPTLSVPANTMKVFEWQVASAMAEYRFGTTTTTYASTDTDAGSTAGNISLGSGISGGISTTTGNLSNSLFITGANSATEADAISNSKYIECTITPGSTVSFESLYFNYNRDSTVSATNFSVRSSADNYATKIGSGALTTTAAWTPGTHGGTTDLRSVAALQNVSTAKTFRIYFWGGTDTTTATRIDNIIVTKQ